RHRAASRHDSRRPPPSAPHPDDRTRSHRRHVAPRLRPRRWLADAPAPRHRCHRWSADFNGFVASRHPSRVFPPHSNQASAGDNIVRSQGKSSQQDRKEMSMSVKINSEKTQSLLGRATAFFVYLFEKVMPDPFVFAVILTFVGALLALWFAPNATLPSVASAWYGGIFAI